MLSHLSAAWRARRVLLIGSGDDASSTLEAWLTILGARCAVIAPDTQAEMLYRRLTEGRIFAVILCSMPKENFWRNEIRETGIPLTIICPTGDVQEAALRALQFGARFLSEGLPCGIYDLCAIS